MATRYATPSLFFISRVQAEIDRLFQEALQLGVSSVAMGDWQPCVDVVETPETVVILAELPGISAADLKVEVRGTLVHLSGVKATLLPSDQRPSFHRLERGHGKFAREIHLFSPVNTHHGTARLVDGLLTIEFPKVEEKRHAARLLYIEEVGATAESTGERQE